MYAQEFDVSLKVQPTFDIDKGDSFGNFVLIENRNVSIMVLSIRTLYMQKVLLAETDIPIFRSIFKTNQDFFISVNYIIKEDKLDDKERCKVWKQQI